MPARLPTGRCQGGATLVELVISIVIIGLAVSGVMMAMSQSARHSANPVIQQQAVAIAEAYFEEIALLAFDEVAATGVGPDVGGPEAGETRATYDDVNDYDGHSDAGPRSLDSPATVITGLDDYTVSVSVTNTGVLGPGGAQVAAADALRIDVAVTHPLGVNLAVSGFRTRY